MTDWLSLAADPTPFISLVCLGAATAALLWGASWRHTAHQAAERAERNLRRAKAAEGRMDLLDEAMAHLEADHAAEVGRIQDARAAESDEWAIREQNHAAACLWAQTEPEQARWS